jgi:hypothetical protein
MKKLKVSEAVRAICKALANDEASLNILVNEIYEAEKKKRRKNGTHLSKSVKEKQSSKVVRTRK